MSSNSIFGFGGTLPTLSLYVVVCRCHLHRHYTLQTCGMQKPILLCKPVRAITAAVRVFCAIVHSTCGFAGDFIPLSKNLQSISLVMASCPRKRNYIRGFLKCGYPKKWMIWVPQKQQSPNLRWQLRLWTWISLQRNQDWILSCQTANMLTHVDNIILWMYFNVLMWFKMSPGSLIPKCWTWTSPADTFVRIWHRRKHHTRLKEQCPRAWKTGSLPVSSVDPTAKIFKIVLSCCLKTWNVHSQRKNWSRSSSCVYEACPRRSHLIKMVSKNGTNMSQMCL